jgi:hypothetical protein
MNRYEGDEVCDGRETLVLKMMEDGGEKSGLTGEEELRGGFKAAFDLISITPLGLARLMAIYN